MNIPVDSVREIESVPPSDLRSYGSVAQFTEKTKPERATYYCSGGQASQTNLVFECSWREERIVIYVCLTIIAVCWILGR
jgi:hypothetical protein